MGLEGVHDPATSSGLQSSWNTMCFASSKRPDSSTEHQSSPQRQLKAWSAVISNSVLHALVLVPHYDIAGSVSNENTMFMYGINLTQLDNYKSGIGHRRVFWGCKKWPWQAECRCSILFEIQGMSKLRDRLNNLQTCKGGCRKYYDSGRTPCWEM